MGIILKIRYNKFQINKIYYILLQVDTQNILNLCLFSKWKLGFKVMKDIPLKLIVNNEEVMINEIN